MLSALNTSRRPASCPYCSCTLSSLPPRAPDFWPWATSETCSDGVRMTYINRCDGLQCKIQRLHPLGVSVVDAADKDESKETSLNVNDESKDVNTLGGAVKVSNGLMNNVVSATCPCSETSKTISSDDKAVLRLQPQMIFGSEYRKYDPECRPDRAVEVEEVDDGFPDAAKSFAVFYAPSRADGVCSYARKYDFTRATWQLFLTCNPKGKNMARIKRITVSLRQGFDLNPLQDTVVNVALEKVNHVAIELHPPSGDSDGSPCAQVRDVYQDFTTRTLQISEEIIDDGNSTTDTADDEYETVEDEEDKANTHFKNTVFNNFEATDDPRYEPARWLVMTAIYLLLRQEREVLCAFPKHQGSLGVLQVDEINRTEAEAKLGVLAIQRSRIFDLLDSAQAKQMKTILNWEKTF